MNIEDLRNLLRTDLVTVTFTKKDGSSREMLCTTMPDYLPPMNDNTTSKTSDSILTVWDLENSGWRSFKFDSIQSVFTDYFNYALQA